MVIEYLTEVKSLFVRQKAEQQGIKSLEEVEITDEDLAELTLLDQIIVKKQAEFASRMDVLQRVVDDSIANAKRKIESLKVTVEKTKRIVENSVFIEDLNKGMEKRHEEVFKEYFKIQLLNYTFVSSQQFFRSAEELEKAFYECIVFDSSVDKYQRDWLDRR